MAQEDLKIAELSHVTLPSDVTMALVLVIPVLYCLSALLYKMMSGFQMFSAGSLITVMLSSAVAFHTRCESCHCCDSQQFVVSTWFLSSTSIICVRARPKTTLREVLWLRAGRTVRS